MRERACVHGVAGQTRAFYCSECVPMSTRALCMPLFVLVPLIALATQRAFDAEQQIFIDQHQITTVARGHAAIGLALLYATRVK